MSRVAKNPIQVGSGVEVVIEGGRVAVKGPLGT
jgi:ribosomal protein L6P/L9E